jgi:hypothetical protein
MHLIINAKPPVSKNRNFTPKSPKEDLAVCDLKVLFRGFRGSIMAIITANPMLP